MQSVFYQNLGAGKQVYDAALRCFQRREKSFSVKGASVMEELVHEVMSEHPELFYVSKAFYLSPRLTGKECIPTYLYSSSETEKLRHELDAAAQKIIRENINEHQSDYDKVRVLHDFLKSNLAYDYETASGKKSKDRRTAEAFTIVGALLNHRCVCEGFSLAFKYLCDRVGLECWVVTGTGSATIERGSHAWNIVRINGYYHHVDVTWDNQYSDSDSMPNYGYMNLSDEEIAKDHTWNRRNYPACPSSPYNYFRVNNALVDSKAQLENMLYNAIQSEEEYILFRVVRGSILEREIMGCLSECIQRASDRCRHISVTDADYGGVTEQLTFFVRPQYSYQQG